MVIKNIYAATAITSLHLTDLLSGRCRTILDALYVARHPSSITTTKLHQLSLRWCLVIIRSLLPNILLWAVSMSSLFGNWLQAYETSGSSDHTALSMFYLGKNSFRNIALIFQILYRQSFSYYYQRLVQEIRSHVPKLSLQLMPALNFDSDGGIPMRLWLR